MMPARLRDAILDRLAMLHEAWLRHRDEIIDQALHIAWGLAAGLLTGGVWAGLLAGLVVALPRELVDQRPPGGRWPPRIGAGKAMEIIVFALAGAIGGALA